MNTIHAAQAGQGGPVTIACINKATVDLGVPFDKLTATLQKCYDQHFLPVWGYPVKLYNTKVAKPSDWQFVYFDDADTAGALGYHDLTKDGQPVSKIFVKTTLADNQLVSVTACHELFEMVIDPIANLWAEAADGTEYAYEMCDPVEEDTFLVDGIEMSNFVHPSWFEPFKHPPGTKYRSSWTAQEALQHDQGRLHDYQEEGQGHRSISAPRQRRSASPRRIDSAIAASIASRTAWSSSRAGVEPQLSAGPLDRLGSRVRPA